MSEPSPEAPTSPEAVPARPARPSLGRRVGAMRRIDWARHYDEARTRTAADAPVAAPRRRIDVTTWSGALVFMVLAAAVLWIVQIVNVADHYRLNRFGLRPRTAGGLWGVLTETFLHDSWSHLLSNTISFVIIGGAVALGGLRYWIPATVLIIGLGGLLTWLVAPSGLIVGASVLIFGWLGYLISRAYFSRKLRWIFAAVVVVGFFAGLLSGLVPSLGSHVSWQSHLCGFGCGLLAGALLHPRRRTPASAG